MRFRWALWLFEISLTALVCFADEPGTSTASSPVLAKRERIDLTFKGCGSRTSQLFKKIRTNQETNMTDSELGLSSGREIGEAPYAAVDGEGNHSRKSINKPVIVGGVDAIENSWPWMAGLFKKPEEYRRFLCGASLISHYYILTAAHCFGKEDVIIPSNFVVLLGGYTKKEGTEYRVEKVVIHGEYKKKHGYNDIAVLRLAEKVRFTYKVAPVCVPSDGLRSKIIPYESNTTVIGWGYTAFGGVSSKVLQEVTVPVVPLKICNDVYAKFWPEQYPRGVTDNLICAGFYAGGKDACEGDSGGPMMIKLQDNTWVQLGIVTAGYGCGDEGFPGVYTRLSSYTSWLDDNTDLG